MKKHLILILPILIGCTAPLYHCEKENNPSYVYHKAECDIFGNCGVNVNQQIDHKYTECYPEKADNDD